MRVRITSRSFGSKVTPLLDEIGVTTTFASRAVAVIWPSMSPGMTMPFSSVSMGRSESPSVEAIASRR